MKRNKYPWCSFVLLYFLILVLCTMEMDAKDDATFSTRLKGISFDLGKALHDVFHFKTIKYTPVPNNATYISHVVFEPKGMAGLYNVTHWFMDVVQPKELFPEDFTVRDSHGNVHISNMIDQWPSVLKHCAGLLTLTIIGLLFAIIMPLVGFIFCCCRCCGNCGARSQPFDKKHDMCRKVVLGMFLICVATLILFGVVCSFVSNKHLQDSTEELPDELRDLLTDVETYMNSTGHQMDTILLTNYKELQTSMFDILDHSTQVIEEKLKNYTKAVSFQNLKDFVTGMGSISKDLTEMKTETNFIRNKASQLSDGLRRVKRELLHTLSDCANDFHVQQCIDANDQVSKMSITMDFDTLPDVTRAIDDMDNLINKDHLIEEINKGTKEYENIPRSIAKAVNDCIPPIKSGLKAVGEALKAGDVQLDRILNELLTTINREAHGPINHADRALQQYSPYRYYVGVFVSSTLLLIIVCITFGLMCGVCGKRPDGYDDDCCNKGGGSKLLMLSVAVMFLFATILMVITIVYFLSGIILQRFACDPLEDPDNSRLFAIVNNELKLRSIIDTDLNKAIKSCHQNQSIYNVLNLETKFNMSEVTNFLDKYNITDEINNFKAKIRLNKNITILDKQTEDDVRKLKDSAIADIDFDKFIYIDENLTTVDLNDLADQLKNAANQLPDVDGAKQLKMSINQNEMYLRMYQKELVTPMIQTTKKLKDQANGIEKAMKFGHDNFNEAIDDTLEEVKFAQNYINQNGTALLKQLAAEYGNSFKSKIQDYLNYVANTIMNEIGRCGPLSNVYNMTLVITCDKILNPWNGFWLSVGWCLVLFVPTIILSVKLATLYQKSDPYPGPLVEQEYLYDAYADRDNIPLSNSGKKGKKKKKKYQRETSVYEAHGASGDSSRNPEVGRNSVASRERDTPGGSSSHPDARYADMAPKHWEDYPNGGPPQYQTAPLAAEYERPPPYYYPGPGSNRS